MSGQHALECIGMKTKREEIESRAAGRLRQAATARLLQPGGDTKVFFIFPLREKGFFYMHEKKHRMRIWKTKRGTRDDCDALWKSRVLWSSPESL